MKPYTKTWWVVAWLGQVYKVARDPKNAGIYYRAMFR